DLPCTRIEVDEIWSFVYAKEKNVSRAKSAPPKAGDVWTWTAICAHTKLVPSWIVGDRTSATGIEFMDDLRGRLANRVQLTSDGHSAYLQAVEGAFGGDVDYAMLVKLYGKTEGEGNERRYSPAECIGAKRKIIEGKPNKALISTSYAERQNLTMRMSMRRFTRLTNAFSKKVENHAYSVALHFMHYNFCRIHQTLGVTPAMEAGVTERLWEVSDIAKLVEAAAPKPGPRGPYKKRAKDGGNSN
ncbi:MAG: IS1 family transposase, partial [Gammaproteobacteria bacterium]|nr:IS1 family transposase [Gammaproteobacteria bacterium]